MESLKEEIQKKKPNLSKGSISTYMSLLKSLYKKADTQTPILEWINKQDENIKLLSDVNPSVRKTVLSALVCVADQNDKYKILMMKDGEKYVEQMKKQEKSPAQAENWQTQEQIKEVYEKLLNENKDLLKKEELNNNEFQKLQNLIILSLYYLIPPRRLKDFTDFKIKNINKKTDNYKQGNKLKFNSYKTDKFYGEQTVEAPPTLNKLLNKFIKLNKNDYLLVDSNNNNLTSVKLNQRLNVIFGKKASVNILRHSYLSSMYQGIPELTKMEETAKDMGHSIKEALQYIKK